MKLNLICFAILTALILPLKAEEKAAFKDEKEKISYSIGVNIGSAWKRQEIEVDPEFVFKGLKDALSGGQTLLTEQEVRETISAFQNQLRAKQETKRRELGGKNKADGETFLSENKTKPGVVTLPSGLQYKIITEGAGASPKATDTVTVNYRGTLIDGTEFDSSFKRNAPASFRVDAVIKGWTEALQLMKEGSKWQLFIPAELAYAERGTGSIPPNAALIFEVELISIKPEIVPTIQPNQPVTSDIIKVPSAEELAKGAKIEVIKAEDLKKIEEQQRLEQQKKAKAEEEKKSK